MEKVNDERILWQSLYKKCIQVFKSDTRYKAKPFAAYAGKKKNELCCFYLSRTLKNCKIIRQKYAC